MEIVPRPTPPTLLVDNTNPESFETLAYLVSVLSADVILYARHVAYLQSLVLWGMVEYAMLHTEELQDAGDDDDEDDEEEEYDEGEEEEEEEEEEEDYEEYQEGDEGGDGGDEPPPKRQKTGDDDDEKENEEGEEVCN